MANQHHNGGRDTPSEDNRTNWRPQDLSPQAQSYRRTEDNDRSWRDRGYRDDDRRTSERDPRRWEGGRGSEVGYYEDREGGWRSTERHGQGQSGYGAGRQGDDRSQRTQNRNDMTFSAASFEDRHQDLGVDDRFTGRGRGSYWQDRGGFEPDHYPTRGAHDSPRGFSGRDAEYDRGGRGGRYEERMGYQGSQATQPGGYAATHVHRGSGPHRGKGPVGYQRSDERIREMVCESLTDDDQIDASQIEVTVRNGEVMLSGMVDDRRSKRGAEDCAYSVSGVRDVQNLLRVKDDERGRSNPFGASAVGSSDTDTAHDRKHRA